MSFINTQDLVDFGGKTILCTNVYAQINAPEQVGYNTPLGSGVGILLGPAGGGGSSGVPNQRSVTTASTIQAADVIINCSLSAPATFTLPQASTRAGKQVTFVDANNSAGTNNITIVPFAGDTVKNWTTPTSVVMNGNGQVVTFRPFNDSVNVGWFIE